MNEHKNEQLSALVDGELDDDEITGKLANDMTMRRKWRRYTLISDAMHNSSPLHPDPRLASTISELISREPVVFAPERRSRTRYAYLKPAAGMAIAASVAMLAILGIQQTWRTEGVGPTVSPPELAQVQDPALELRLPAQQVSVNVDQPPQIRIQSNARMSRYLMNHGEFQTSVGVQGAMPYVRLVSTDNDQ